MEAIKNNHKTVLTHCGYALPIDTISKRELDLITGELSIQPISHPNYPTPMPVKAFEFNSSGKHIRLPKYYAVQKFGPPSINKQKKWKHAVPITFKGQFRENQVEPFNVTLNHLKKNKSGVLCLGTGYGKTLVAIAILCAMQRRTLILVHTTNLIDQWKERIQQFAPDTKIGFFYGNKRPKQEDDVVIATFHSVCKPENIRLEDQFGLVIIDECQFVSATTFSKTFFTVNSEYTLAISATPDRADGLEKILYLHVGPIFYQKATSVENHQLHVRYVHIDTPRKWGFHPGTHKPMHSLMITELSQDEERNKQVLKIILPTALDTSRFLLIFCERREQAQYFQQQLQLLIPHRSIGLKLGDTKRDELNSDIIISTYQSLGVGVEVVKINALVFVSPKTGRRMVEQAMSRVLRQPHSNGALLIDIVDGFLQSGASQREKVYRARMGKNITIEHVEY